MKTLENVDLADKKLLIRVDFNVPMVGEKIEDANRIDAALPTIELCLERGAKEIILISHRGQPKKYPDTSLSLEPVAQYLAAKYDFSLKKIANYFPEKLDAFQVAPHVVLVENIRFTPKEEEDDAQFAVEMSKCADIFIYDAFAVAHRAHASTVGISTILPSYVGLLVQKEIGYLDPIRENTRHPFVAMIGGAKVADKLPMIEFLARQADWVLVGGAVANTFLAASGADVKKSLVESDQIEAAKQITELLGEKLVLPEDYVWSTQDEIMDIGPKTVMRFMQRTGSAKLVFWNGNLGKTENVEFAEGSLSLARFLAVQVSLRVVAGGDTVGFLSQHNLAERMSFVSTGGSATLEYLAGKDLPALKALA